MPTRVGLVIIGEEGILLLYRKRGEAEYYTVPGGGVEEEETIEVAAIREAKEETNLDVTHLIKLGEFEVNGQKEVIFFADHIGGEPKLGGPELLRQSETNIYRLEWVSLDRLREINLREEIKELIRAHLKRKGYPGVI